MTIEALAHRHATDNGPCPESAFRRGYAHAVEQAILAASRGASTLDLVRWSYLVAAWRESQVGGDTPPRCPIE